MQTQRLTISSLLEVSKTRTQGFSSSRIRIDPTVVGRIAISPDYPQLLELRDSTGNIPCVCPEFSLDILCTSISATRWYFTLVDNPEIFRLPAYYLEISEFHVTNNSPEQPMNESIQHSIVTHPDSDRVTLCGLLLHVYPVFKLTQFTYLALFQVGVQRMHIFFTGDDFLSLHSLLCTNQAYCVTNISLRQIMGEDKSVKTFITTDDTTVMSAGPAMFTNDVTTSIHDSHSTLEEIVTKLVDIEPGHFLLNSSIHLFLTHFPSCLPIWGLRIGAKIRISEAILFSAELDGTTTQFVWCCHHTRIQLITTSKRPRKFIPYLPEAFLTRLIYAKLVPSSSVYLTRLVEKFKESFEFSYRLLPSLIKMFELQFLPKSTLIVDIRRIIFTDKCIITPFTELSTHSVILSISKLISCLSVQMLSDMFFDNLSNFTINFSAYPYWDRTSYDSLIEERMKGFLIGRIELCPVTGHVVLSDSTTKLPVYFVNGILPSQLVQLVGSLVAIREYVLTVETCSFPNYAHRLKQPCISTRYKNITTVLPTQTIQKKTSSYIMLVIDKSNITLEASTKTFAELRFQISVKIFMNSATPDSQDPTQSLVGQLTIVFLEDTIKWWNFIQIGWLYHWSGFDSSEVNPYHILRGCRTLFSSSWSLYPIGEMPAKQTPSFENDIISLLHKVKEAQGKTCLVAGFVQRISFLPRTFPTTKLVCQNNEWAVDIPNLKPVSLRHLHKIGISLLPLFYTIQLALTFPVTDSVFLPVYINLPHCRMPLNLDKEMWVKLTGVKLKYVNNMLKGNVDYRGSISDIWQPPSSNLIPSIYKKLKPLSPDNFNTFRTLCVRVARSQSSCQNEVQPPQTAPVLPQPPPTKGMYSNKFALSRDQRYIDMEKIRMGRFAALLRSYKILRVSLRLDNLFSITISKNCLCCKASMVSNCPRCRIKLTAFFSAYVSGYKVTVKVINRCVVVLTSISQSRIAELRAMLEGINQIEVDRNYFELNGSRRPAPDWIRDWFTNSSWLSCSKIDGIVTHYTTMQEQCSDSICFQLTLHHFRYI